MAASAPELSVSTGISSASGSPPESIRQRLGLTGAGEGAARVRKKKGQEKRGPTREGKKRFEPFFQNGWQLRINNSQFHEYIQNSYSGITYFAAL
jgi:hypothetical protein